MEYFFGRQEAKVKSANEKKMIFSENSFGRAGGWPQALKHTQNLLAHLSTFQNAQNHVSISISLFLADFNVVGCLLILVWFYTVSVTEVTKITVNLLKIN